MLSAAKQALLFLPTTTLELPLLAVAPTTVYLSCKFRIYGKLTLYSRSESKFHFIYIKIRTTRLARSRSPIIAPSCSFTDAERRDLVADLSHTIPGLYRDLYLSPGIPRIYVFIPGFSSPSILCGVLHFSCARIYTTVNHDGRLRNTHAQIFRCMRMRYIM